MSAQTVTLHRTGSSQKVGLTLCYGATYDGLTDVFIGEVSMVSRARTLVFFVLRNIFSSNTFSRNFSRIVKSLIFFAFFKFKKTFSQFIFIFKHKFIFKYHRGQ